MKRKSIAIILIFAILITLILPITTHASTLANNELLSINGYTITNTTTIAQINSVLGNPQIETDSAFGGKAYSYYDTNYTYYLYIETNESGSIMGTGAIGGNFIGKRYANGDIDDSYYWYLSGTVLSDFSTNEVYAIMDYHCASADVETYWTNYEANSSKYLYELQKHSIAVSKTLAVREGDSFTQTFSNEDVFYMNEQLKYNNSDLYEYAQNSGKTKAISFIRGGTGQFYNELPNPILFGGRTEGYIRAENYQYVLYDINMTNYSDRTYYEQIMFIDPSFAEERKTIELTDEEKTKLTAALVEYEKYKEHGEAIVNIYDEEPQYSTLPLSAGKYNNTVLQHVTDYINIARAGLGIGTLTLNEEIADCAQHKAVLVYYMSANGMSTGHFPSQPDGVSDEFYNKAQSYMNENLYMGTIQSSIDYALNDGYGDAVECGHRYNLLDPRYTQWGIGSVGTGSFGSQGAHKFSGITSFNNELVAWPSNGIMPLDMVSRGIGNWTANFYGNYKVSTDTEVTIECLNTDKVYEITKANSSQEGKFLRTTGENLVTFRDDSITYEHGDVFEITLHNVVRSSDSAVTDYTYRSVFYNFYQADSTPVTDITLNKESITTVVGGNNRILAKATPDDASIKLMKFTSSDTDTVKVRQDGTITGIKEGTATIEIKCGNITKTVSVTVSKGLKGDINKDGKVNISDARYGLAGIVKNTLTEEEIQLGDVDGNSKCNISDIRRILMLIVGKISEL